MSLSEMCPLESFMRVKVTHLELRCRTRVEWRFGADTLQKSKLSQPKLSQPFSHTWPFPPFHIACQLTRPLNVLIRDLINV